MESLVAQGARRAPAGRLHLGHSRRWARLERPPARERQLAVLRRAERRRNRQRLEVVLPTPEPVADTGGATVAGLLVRAAVLSVLAWLLIEVVLPVLLALARAPYG